ncbi:hypothetical protein CBR_g45220 [Chara braunii]|uniref:Zinc finger LSD1-type domain-containing protein n=1 Tax=Chara braunii TaxID=69332 RepID=A0A388K380_CHABU|nr:hypothetical protein CBR_g45220 [Chara braunii]|eukprot:GBG64524.1 hypothetical protein CBR_g45220 [Chara braunii]
MDKLAKLGKLAEKAGKIGNLVQPFMGGAGQQHAAAAQSAPPPPPYGQYGGGQGYASHAPAPYAQPSPAGQVILLTCIKCNSTLQLPAEAKSVICGACHHVFHVGYPTQQQQQQLHSYPPQPSRPTPSAPPVPPPAGYPQSRSLSGAQSSAYPSW